MSLLVIGADNLGNIMDNLKQRGFDKINHVSGRKKKEKSYNIPAKTDVVLILTDYVNHQIAKALKKQVKNNKTKVLFTKRSWAHIEKQLNAKKL